MRIFGARLRFATVLRLLLLSASVLWATVAALASTATVPAAAHAAHPHSSTLDVYVGYADNLRPSPTNFPTPWEGDAGVIFEGCSPSSSCSFDAGAVRLVNNTGAGVTIDSVILKFDVCTFDMWPHGVSLPTGGQLIVTQTVSGASNGCTPGTDVGPDTLDSSDFGPGGAGWAGNCSQSGIIPEVDVSVDGTPTSHLDAGQVLNTGGVDQASCDSSRGPAGNESAQWQLIGQTTVCNVAVLTLTPPSQTHMVGTTANLTANLTNNCNQALQGVTVHFTALSGPNSGLTGTGTTDSGGNAPFSYSSAHPGTDTWQASITNLAGTFTSNTVTVTWTVPYLASGAFVIGDQSAAAGGTQTFWSAQWWKANSLSGGAAPAGFKGFEDSLSNPTCGATWTTDPGNSPPPPATVPAFMAVIVSSSITQSGSTITGNIVHLYVVQTNPGYAPDPGHTGTGTLRVKVC
jgi:hypothetical protein